MVAAAERLGWVQDIADAVVGWRTWSLVDQADGSGPLLRPVAAGRRPWPAREAALGTCRVSRRHVAPVFGCLCGLHASRDPEGLRRIRDPAVLGTVALWGRVVEHDRGFRGERGYPQRLALICYLCLWRHGTGACAPDVVVRLRWGRLVPLCQEHLALSERYDFPVPELLSPREVERSLLDRYAVDRLAA
jgi:hypothetical protein